MERLREYWAGVQARSLNRDGGLTSNLPCTQGKFRSWSVNFRSPVLLGNHGRTGQLANLIEGLVGELLNQFLDVPNVTAQ